MISHRYIFHSVCYTRATILFSNNDEGTVSVQLNSHYPTDNPDTIDLNLINGDQDYPIVIADTPPSLTQLTELE